MNWPTPCTVRARYAVSAAATANAACGAQDPGFFGQENTPNIARDLDRIRAALPERNLKVQTGRENADEQAGILNGLIGRIIRYALLGFTGVAVLVGAFIIFNTFSITVAQRLREFAMLRTIGASRRQILGSVLGEAALIAVVATLIGLVLGVGFAWGLNRVFELIGFGLPATAIRMPWQAVVVSFAIGVGVTLLAAAAPALRAKIGRAHV